MQPGLRPPAIKRQPILQPFTGATLSEPTSRPTSAGAAAPVRRVLVVDDSETIRRSAEIFLRLTGLEVILANDGFDALAKISDFSPDLILVDIMMPKLDGYQLCQIVKHIPPMRKRRSSCSPAKTVFLTAHAAASPAPTSI
jgi:CheY-like chemotaxis protein